MKKLGRAAFHVYARLGSSFDGAFLVEDVPESQVFGKWAACGSREVTGPSTARQQFANSHYVGFDYYPGKNVDVVGDVHPLSSYFTEEEKFDIIYSIASFEHFAMPWIVAGEIAKMLKVGGILMVATHFSFGSHERPWIFFQFSDMGLRILFSSSLGFECIDAGMSHPIVGRFAASSNKGLRYQPVKGFFLGSE